MNFHFHLPCSIPVVVHFADGSKVTVKLPSTATASDLLENVKDKLTSSAAQLWLVDVNGDGESSRAVAA